MPLVAYAERTGRAVVLNRVEGSGNRGGEGELCEIAGRQDVIAKIFFDHIRSGSAYQEKLEKLRVMIRQEHKLTIDGRPVCAWPFELLKQNNEIIGLIMPRLPGDVLTRYFSPSSHNASTYDLYEIAINTALAFKIVHDEGIIVGDVHPGNLLVDEKYHVGFVDTDSFQIKSHDGTIYRCGVAIMDFLPPELQTRSISTTVRALESDIYSLGILIFNVLVQQHPFDYVHKPPRRETQDRIRVGAWMYTIKRFYRFGKNFPKMTMPAPNSVPWDEIDPKVRSLFHKLFDNGHRRIKKRPSVGEIIEVLRAAQSRLVQDDKGRWFSPHVGPAWFYKLKKAHHDRTMDPRMTRMGIPKLKKKRFNPLSFALYPLFWYCRIPPRIAEFTGWIPQNHFLRTMMNVLPYKLAILFIVTVLLGLLLNPLLHTGYLKLFGFFTVVFSTFALVKKSWNDPDSRPGIIGADIFLILASMTGLFSFLMIG